MLNLFRSLAIITSGLLAVACVAGQESAREGGQENAMLAAKANPDAKEDATEAASHMAHSHGAGGHQMTPEQMQTLRGKIPLYARYTDDQIMMWMSRMDNFSGWMGEEGVRDGKIGILGLAHGFKEPGNSQFRTAFTKMNGRYPSTYALGMAMMTSDHIQTAINDLEAAGAETIVVMPTTTADNSTLTRQWDYIFGREEVSAYLDVPRVKSNARLVFTGTPTAHPIVAEIMLDYALEKSTDPINEAVVILGHGPQSKEDNAKEMEILARHAEYIKTQAGFHDVVFGNVQDDTPPEVRAANVVEIRALVQEHLDMGHKVIAVTTNLVQSGITGRLENDISDLAEFNNKGLMLHPRFEAWIDEVVEASLKESAASLDSRPALSSQVANN